MYNATELSTDAERIKLYRASKTVVEARLRSEAELWDEITLFAGYSFLTAKRLSLTYSVKGNELFVNKKEKSIARATVELAYQRVQVNQITGPKQIGTFGASYLYPMFVRFDKIKA